ncbi:MAG: phage replisome organizer N-terminal domain-containing protein [Bacilli bacterium]|jgi:hypothetical protein
MSKKDNNSKSRYYWLKFYVDIFFSDAYDYIMSLENGPTVFAIWINLLAKAINKNGKFVTKINEVTVIDSVEKITRDLKYFKYEQILFSLSLFERLGIMGKDENGTYFFIDYDKYIGSETKAAIRQRRSRGNKKLLENKRDSERDNVTKERDSERDNVTKERDSERDNVTKERDSERDNVTKERDNVTYRHTDIQTYRDEDNKRQDIEREDTKTTDTQSHDEVCESDGNEFLSILKSYDFPPLNEKAFIVTISHLKKTYSEDDIKLALIQVVSGYSGQPLTNSLRWLQTALTSTLQNLENLKEVNERQYYKSKMKAETNNPDAFKEKKPKWTVEALIDEILYWEEAKGESVFTSARWQKNPFKKSGVSDEIYNEAITKLKNNYDEIIKKRNETADHIWDKLKDLEEKEGL